MRFLHRRQKRRRRQKHADRPSATTIPKVSTKTNWRAWPKPRTTASGGPYRSRALLTDGLRAEREQGITIDVAYRYFSTPKRKFIIADTPGHEQYTRNMATGASTSDLAIILIDARNGVHCPNRAASQAVHTPPTCWASSISWSLSTRWISSDSTKPFTIGEFARPEFTGFMEKIGAPAPLFIPISERDGDNVVDKSVRSPWYQGPALLEYLEEVPADIGIETLPARFPVQYVLRPNLDFRGYAGQLASTGVFRKGDTGPGLTRAQAFTALTRDWSLTMAIWPLLPLPNP